MRQTHDSNSPGAIADAGAAFRMASFYKEAARRAALAGEARPKGVKGPPLRHFLGELSVFAEPLRRLGRDFPIERTDNPRTVMLLPGFATHPVRMRYMAQQLERAGHKVKRWGLGFNLGPTEQNLALLERRLVALRARYGRPVVLVGWSLGGLFARELLARMISAITSFPVPLSPWMRTVALLCATVFASCEICFAFIRKKPVDCTIRSSFATGAFASAVARRSTRPAPLPSRVG